MTNRSRLISRTKVDGCFFLQNPSHEDDRGLFIQACYPEDLHLQGLPFRWRQHNVSVSRFNVLRGLHIQRKKPQGKLVRCLSGTIYDVCLDLRKDSPTFKKWQAVHLDNPAKAFYIPPGCAHGFLAASNNSIVYYACTTDHDSDSDGGVNAFKAGVTWPTMGKPIMSEKDINLPSMDEWLADPRGVKYE